MKIKCEFTIPLGQFANAKPQLEIDIPDGLTGIEQYKYLVDMLSEFKEPEKKPFKKFEDMTDEEFKKESAKMLEKKPTLKRWINQMYDKRGLDRDHTNGLDEGEEKEYKGSGTREHFTAEEVKAPF